MGVPSKINPGDPFDGIHAASWNAFRDSYFDVRSLMRRGAPPALDGGSPSYLQVRVVNTTEDTIRPGDILGYTDPQFTDIDNDKSIVVSGPVFKGITPSLPEHANQFLVAMEFAKNKQIVRAGFMGIFWVRVNWTDAGHARVKVADGKTVLQSSDSDTDIKPIWKHTIPDSLPAEIWAIILVGGGGVGGETALSICTADGDIPGRSDATTPGTGVCGTTYRGPDVTGQTVENWSGTTITDGSYMPVAKIDGTLVVRNAFC